MKLDYDLKLEQTQKLIITPELKLAITLLQYSTLDLQDHIQQELVDNPVLEVVEGPEDEKNDGAEAQQEITDQDDIINDKDFPWDEYMQDMGLDSSTEKGGNVRKANDNQPALENCAGVADTMLEDLLSQLRMLSINDRQYKLAAFLAGNLDRNGYLQGELEEFAPVLGVKVRELEDALKLVQRLEPPGVGCRNLQECLCLQIKKVSNPPDMVIEIVNQYLPAAADGRYRYIASRLKCNEETVKKAVEYIRTLNPKPGSVYGEGEETRYIMPDVIVEKVDGQYVVTGNEGTMPQLMISPFYKKMLQGRHNDDQLCTFIKNKIEKAFWLIRSIEQRRVTLFKVAQQIVDIQKPFLDQGIKKLKPLTLKEVAQNVGVHESTVSRAAANKYVQTPRGLFPLKFFFSSGFSKANGSGQSAPSIKTHIREIIDSEDPGKPLSDKSLTALLKERNIVISRRTVAKYREDLSIPPSYKRRN